jgi:TRAP-type mannitol/chloroaromatic compound transport system permease small subunit
MSEERPIRKMCDAVDDGLIRLGKCLSWLNAILILVIVTQVTLRYGFGHGLVILEELEWHLYSVAFMFGLSYALVTDAHVRVDLLHGRLSKKTQHWIEILGTLFLLLPFIVAVMIHGWDFFYDSWIHNERSSAPLGLPWRWAIKGAIPLSFGVLGIAALSRMIRSFTVVFGQEDGNH